MTGEVDVLELGVADPLTGLVGLLEMRRRHAQPRSRRGAADVQQYRQRAETNPAHVAVIWLNSRCSMDFTSTFPVDNGTP